jgi:hypothetical protein
MDSRLKNSKSDIVVAGLAAIAFLDRSVRGVFCAEATSLVRGSATPRSFIGDSAVLLGLLHLGFSCVFVGYLLRFNRWKSLLYIGLLISWLLVVAVTLTNI